MKVNHKTIDFIAPLITHSLQHHSLELGQHYGVTYNAFRNLETGGYVVVSIINYKGESKGGIITEFAPEKDYTPKEITEAVVKLTKPIKDFLNNES